MALREPRPTPRASRRLAAVTLVLLLILPKCEATEPWELQGCEPELDGRSVARVWDEQLLSLIRQVIPAPTVHARNLFHLSAAMWDAWAAYAEEADGYFVTEKLSADDEGERHGAREAAISFAAYRLLLWRYADVGELATAQDELDATMASLCYRSDYVTADGDSAAALGNRIAATVIAAGLEDGSNESERYADAAYRPTNEPLVVADPGAPMVDPNRWQPLSLGQQIAQNGLLIPGKVQTFIGPHWGHVAAFAMPPSEVGTPIDPGPPPLLGDPASDAEFKQQAVEIIALGAQLDPSDGVMVDIGPAAMGDNPLGTNEGRGYANNPVTGEPYAADRVLRADYARAVVEFWADGPESETPPGHWNVVANYVSDAPGIEHRLGGDGPVLDRLEWDVKLYFALNGAVHDAAIAAWGVKGHYDSARPISMIRYMGGLGQSSAPDGPAYDPDGLPLVPGLVEVITDASSASGERHAHLRDHVGEIAVLAWRGPPEDPETDTSGVDWIRAVEWVPYQRPTFVTPAFAGYVSGHSTFSRAGAEVMTAITGNAFFPGGLGEWSVEAGSFIHEEGPTQDLILQWATYHDAADQAGLSRLYGGIHIPADDVAGRLMGAQCGQEAWARALTYFDGSAT